MTTLELYRKHKKGEIGRDRFLYEVRRDNNLPWVTNITSYDDAVKILKNKGIIREELTAEDKFLKAAEYYKKLVPNGTSEEDAKKAIFTALDEFDIPYIDYNIQNFYDNYIKNYLEKEIIIIKESVQTDPIVDSVNPYALKRAVHKLLDKEKVLTNDSYVEALNKAAKKLTTPQAIKQEMFANADTVAKADAKLQTQEVKKANHKDKHNEMKKAKGQVTPKATAATTKENKKTKKPKGVEVMKDKGVEGSEKVLKETVLAELQSYLKKKLKLSENINPNYHVGMEVHLPDGGMGKIVEMIGSTCTVEREDGVHQDLQLSALNYAKKKAMEANEHPAMAEEKVSYEKGIKLADKLVDAIEMFNSLSDEEKEAEAKRLGVDVLAKLKAAHDYIMNKIHDEDNYPAQEEDLNLKELNEQDIQEASSVDSIIRALEEAQEQLRDGVSSLKLARKQMLSSGDPKLSQIGERIYRYMLGHIEPLIDSEHQWLTNDESIQNIIDNLRGNEGEEDDELYEAKDINDPALVSSRARIDAFKNKPKTNPSSKNDIAIEKLQNLKDRIEFEMQNDPEVEPQGGKIADKYGKILNKIDAKITKLRRASMGISEDELDEAGIYTPKPGKKGLPNMVIPDPATEMNPLFRSNFDKKA